MFFVRWHLLIERWKMKKINPNWITSLRFLIFAPLACFFLVNGFLALALVAMIMGEITDALDGYVARKTGQISDFGKIYDPMCDSIFHMVIWISFLAIGWVPIYLVLVFFARYCIVSNIRICSGKPPHRTVSKNERKIKAVFSNGPDISRSLAHFHKRKYSRAVTAVDSLGSRNCYGLFSFDYSRRFWQVVKEKGFAFSRVTDGLSPSVFLLFFAGQSYAPNLFNSAIF